MVPGFISSKFKCAAIAVITIVALPLLADYWLYPSTSGIGGQSFNQGKNGLWLRYLWYFGKHDDQSLDRMTALLNDKQIAFAYFHVRDIGKDGQLKYRYLENAKRLIDAVHERAPATKAIAWVYVGSHPTTGEVDLSQDSVRSAMVKDALWLVNECGFDGVQWDYEFCANGDKNFLRLLEETESALPETAILSTAVPMWYPGTLWGWSDDYFKQVAIRCDQLAVMCYDSFFYLPRAYVWLVHQQAVHVTQAAASVLPKCTVLLGIPSYEQGTAGHSNHAETIIMGLKGVREGLSDSQSVVSQFDGVAVFAEYTTNEEEWLVYDRLWLGTRK